MQSIISQSPHHQDCITKLHRVLDLALITAESASAEGNHKMVIQAAREVTRIVTLINKMTATSDPKPKPKPKTTPVSASRPAGRENQAPPAGKDQGTGSDLQAERRPSENGNQLPETPIFNLEALFPPQEVAAWDAQSQDLFKDISRNWAELQEIGAEMNRSVQKSVNGNGKSAVHK
jgi:hypothetical protein